MPVVSLGKGGVMIAVVVPVVVAMVMFFGVTQVLYGLMLLPCTGSAAFCNKLDALLFVLLLEVGCSDQPLQDWAAYNEMVINNRVGKCCMFAICNSK